MSGLNRYYRRSHIAEKRFRLLIRYFAMDLSASQTAVLSGISRRTTNSIFLKIRVRLFNACQMASPFGSSEVEVDESYFGARRVRGKRGRGAFGKHIVFGIYKRNGFVFTEIVPDVQRKTLQSVIRGRVSLDSIIHSDGWRGYNGLVDTGFDKHYRVNHSKNEFVAGDSHINGIESFWSFAKRRLQKFNGVSKETFYLHLKECEWRFNNRSKNLYLELLKLLRENPL
ncbi:MAG: IS1595 family transposase [Acidobacteriota bacterium]|nr:IS1595 family transposase [Acidobacteriota bacterium]